MKLESVKDNQRPVDFRLSDFTKVKYFIDSVETFLKEAIKDNRSVTVALDKMPESKEDLSFPKVVGQLGILEEKWIYAGTAEKNTQSEIWVLLNTAELINNSMKYLPRPEKLRLALPPYEENFDREIKLTSVGDPDFEGNKFVKFLDVSIGRLNGKFTPGYQKNLGGLTPGEVNAVLDVRTDANVNDVIHVKNLLVVLTGPNFNLFRAMFQVYDFAGNDYLVFPVNRIFHDSFLQNAIIGFPIPHCTYLVNNLEQYNILCESVMSWSKYLRY